MSDNLNQVDVTIQIAGTTCDYESLTLHQSMHGHHQFEVLVNYKPHKPSLWSTTPETVFEQLGETLDIRMEHKESGELTEFSGLITDIEVGGKDGDQGYALIIGGSPTLLLDRSPSMAAYVDYTIGNLVSEEIENSGIRIDLESKPRFEGILPYVAKYKETSWQFLSRMAALCGEWFYYDGQKLILGNPKREDTTRAAFDMELQQLRIRSKLEQLNTELYDYDPNTDDYKEDAAPESIEGVNSYMRVAKDRASNFYKEPAKLPAGRAMIDESDIMATTRAHFSRVYSQSSVFEAVSNTCAIRVGELVTTRLPESLQKDCGPDLGRYRVLSITHIVDQKGLYRNKFKGVAGATETLPLPEGFKAPMAFPEPATVTDNADPLNMGRVKVRYFWQDEDASTNWMRVQGQSAGSSDVVKKNRGMVFIPEIGDQVMVAFEQGNPDRPYVTGSLFHRDNGGGAATDNNIKSITTRSGHTIEFDDTDGAEKIHIRDNGGSVITFDTQEKSLLISSMETLNLSAKNVNIAAEENVTIGAQKDMNLSSEGNMQAVSKGELALQSDSDTSVSSKGAVSIEATSDATLSGANAIVEGKAAAELNGVQAKVNGSAMAEVAGGIVKIN